MTQVDSALARWLPRVAARVPWVTLGDWPTPIDELSIDGAPLWVKREGDSSARYGGNKVRTLEAWLGHTRASGARRIWAIGAYGSNHVVATVLHAHAIGLQAGAIVFPQSASEWAVENAGALIASGVPIVRLRNAVEVPFAGIAVAAQARWARMFGAASPDRDAARGAGAFSDRDAARGEEGHGDRDAARGGEGHGDRDATHGGEGHGDRDATRGEELRSDRDAGRGDPALSDRDAGRADEARGDRGATHGEEGRGGRDATHGDPARGDRDAARENRDAAHGDPPRGDPPRGDPARGDRDAAHGDAAHGDAAHGDAAHGDAAVGDAAHGDTARGDRDAAHGDAARGDRPPARGEPTRLDRDASTAHDVDAAPLTQLAGAAIDASTRTLAALAHDAMSGLPASPALSMLVGRELARDSIIMPPGGATPIGTLGALSAVFELAEQVASGIAPPPRRIVVPAGSTCTTAGLLAGFVLAHAIGAWRWPVPIVHAVRVTPWPVTSRVVIVRLAEASLARIAALGGPRVSLGAPRLIVDASELGGGYGRVTDHGLDAIRRIGELEHGPRLDGVYSAKAAAALLRLHRRGIGPLLFWATKSTTVLSAPSLQAMRAAPLALVRWLT